MNFWKALFGLLRRRVVGPPVVLLAAALAVGTFSVVPARYVSSTIIMLSPPVNGGVANTNPLEPRGGTNPLLLQTEGLRTAVATLVLTMSVEEVRTAVGAPKDGPTKLTVNDGTTQAQLIGMNGPFLYIEAESATPAQAIDVVKRAHARISTELDWRQHNLLAPPSTYVTLADVVPRTEPEASYSDKIQGAALAFVVGLFLGLSIAYGIVRTLTRRAAARDLDAVRRAEAEPPPTEEPTPAEEEPPAEEEVPEQVSEQEDQPAEKAGAAEEDAPTESFPAVKVDEVVASNGKAKSTPPISSRG